MILYRNAIFYIFLLFSIVFHEFSHAFFAFKAGDDSPAVKKRITFNPLPHIDLWGSVILPVLLILSNAGIIFGWAKPVMLDLNKIKNKKQMILISLVGPFSNLFLAFAFLLTLKMLKSLDLINPFWIEMMFLAIILNIILFFFNMLPIPPLDGSKAFMFFLSERLKALYIKFAPILMLFLLVAILFGFLNPIFRFLYSTIWRII